MGYNLETASSHLATKRGGVSLKVKQHGRKDQRCETEGERERWREEYSCSSPCVHSYLKTPLMLAFSVM